MALTEPKIRNAKLGDKSFKLYDAGGLFLLVQKNGGKWWRLKYRFAGKEKRLSMGTYPDVGRCQGSCRCARKAKWQEATQPCCTSDEGRPLGVAD